MGSLKVWNGTAWETASAQGPAGAAPVSSVDGRVGAVSLSDLYVNTTGDTMTGALNISSAAAGTEALRTTARADQTAATRTARDSAGVIHDWNDNRGYPGRFMQGASSVGTTDVNGAFYINYPEPFLAAIPAVVATLVQSGGWVWVVNVTAYSFGAVVYAANGAPWANALHRVNWVAFEQRPQ